MPERAAALAGVDLSERLGTEGDDGVRYLPTSGGMCGPGATSGPKTSWAGTSAFAFGDVRVGIRYNSQATADLLEKLLVGAHIDDAGVGDNYSVALTDPGSAANDLELLVLGTRQIVRSRSKRRVLTGLLRYLSSDLFDADPSLLHVNATAAVDDGGQGLVLPPGLTGWLGKLQPRLAKLGITLVDMPFVSLDVGTGELVVPPPAVEHDETVLHDSDAGVTLGRTELPMVESGRYPLASWYVHAAEPDGASDREDEEPPVPRSRSPRPSACAPRMTSRPLPPGSHRSSIGYRCEASTTAPPTSSAKPSRPARAPLDPLVADPSPGRVKCRVVWVQNVA